MNAFGRQRKTKRAKYVAHDGSLLTVDEKESGRIAEALFHHHDLSPRVDKEFELAPAKGIGRVSHEPRRTPADPP